MSLCVPSYLRFEPRQATGEEVGALCICAAIFGVLVCVFSVARAVRALVRSSLYLRRCGGLKSHVAGEQVWVVSGEIGLALAGIIRPRLLISGAAMQKLSTGQLALALRHEHAHQTSRDNLKRLMILLAPPVFPAVRALDQIWAKYAEWAADDRATGGDADIAVALAAALVSVARLQSNAGMPPLMAALVDPNEDLSARVDRLINSNPIRERNFYFERMAVATAAVAIVAVASNPASFRTVHRLLELLLD